MKSPDEWHEVPCGWPVEVDDDDYIPLTHKVELRAVQRQETDDDGLGCARATIYWLPVGLLIWAAVIWLLWR
jgi:hypothetical protein